MNENLTCNRCDRLETEIKHRMRALDAKNEMLAALRAALAKAEAERDILMKEPNNRLDGYRELSSQLEKANARLMELRAFDERSPK